MLQIAICDDEKAQLELLDRYVVEFRQNVTLEADITSYQDARKFFFAWEEKRDTDILLLDIEMPGMNGVELARKLREYRDNVQIIFITGNPEYVFEGYDVEAVSYLVKPIREKQLEKALLKAVERCQKREPVLLVEAAGELRKVRCHDIIYLESQGHDTVLNMSHIKTSQLRSKSSLSQLEQELSAEPGLFFKPHRSYLVNMLYVEKITRKEIIVDNGTSIPIARGKWEEVNQAYLKFYRNR